MLFRYLSKKKVEYLLQDKGLYIAPANAMPGDKNEGVHNPTELTRSLRNCPEMVGNDELLNKVDLLLNDLMRLDTGTNFISSWVLDENENKNMWEEYGRDGVVIIVRSPNDIWTSMGSLKRVTKSFPVEYCDEARNSYRDQPFKYKPKKEFEDEKEHRFLVDMQKYSFLTGYDKERFGTVLDNGVPTYGCNKYTLCMSKEEQNQSHDIIKKKGDGYIILMDLNKVIEEVRTFPGCPEDVHDGFVKSFKDAGFHFPVVRSKFLNPC